MTNIFALIVRIILIVAEGMNSKEATIKVAKEASVDFDTLWKNIPKRWK